MANKKKKPDKKLIETLEIIKNILEIIGIIVGVLVALKELLGF